VPLRTQSMMAGKGESVLAAVSRVERWRHMRFRGLLGPSPHQKTRHANLSYRIPSRSHAGSAIVGTGTVCTSTQSAVSWRFA
jgi:hypothetical protein